MLRRNKLSGSQLVEKNIRTFHSLLNSSGELFLRSLEDPHIEMDSNLHPYGHTNSIDVTAFSYAAQRLPDCMDRVNRVILAQSEEVFTESGLEDVFHMRLAPALARRRQFRFDGKNILAAFVTSVSDIDDLVPCLVAYQVEWNKMHHRLDSSQLGQDLADEKLKAGEVEDQLRQLLDIKPDSWDVLRQLWGDEWDQKIAVVALAPKNIRVSMLRGGFTEYRRAVQNWWVELGRRNEETLLEFRPVYFVSSNIHSLANLVSGFCKDHDQEIMGCLSLEAYPDLRRAWRRAEAQDDQATQTNILYYLQKNFFKNNPQMKNEHEKLLAHVGVTPYEEPQVLDLPAQLVDLRKLDPDKLDPRLQMDGLEELRKSRALIINIDYPLGFAAYHTFSQILSSVKQLKGVYVLGKAAIMNGRLGDVLIPSEVYDQHSGNRFFFNNCFSAKDMMDLVQSVGVFDQQKSLCVRGTFLQNKGMMHEFHKEDFNGVEMEAGPYLCAIYENLFPERYPMNSHVNLQNRESFDIGMMHYASDTPYNKRESLLDNSLGFSGVEPTYACTIAILRRIFKNELAGG